MRTFVYKLGGSLLELPNLASRLSEVIQCRPAEHPLLIVGGGTAADTVRDWDRIHGLGEEKSHRLALEAMRLNGLFLQKILPDSSLVETREEARAAWDSSLMPILDPVTFLSTEEQGNPAPLPHHWDVTGDSIAAWVTLQWPAQGMVLLKSVDRPVVRDVDRLEFQAGSDEVDPYFPSLAARLPHLDWVNLRSKTSFVDSMDESDQSSLIHEADQ